MNSLKVCICFRSFWICKKSHCLDDVIELSSVHFVFRTCLSSLERLLDNFNNDVEML